jgi:hypothetical protein
MQTIKDARIKSRGPSTKESPTLECPMDKESFTLKIVAQRAARALSSELSTTACL